MNNDKRCGLHHLNTHRLTSVQLAAPSDVAHLAEDVPDAQPALVMFEPEQFAAVVAAQPRSFSARSDWSGAKS